MLNVFQHPSKTLRRRRAAMDPGVALQTGMTGSRSALRREPRSGWGYPGLVPGVEGKEPPSIKLFYTHRHKDNILRPLHAQQRKVLPCFFGIFQRGA